MVHLHFYIWQRNQILDKWYHRSTNKIHYEKYQTKPTYTTKRWKLKRNEKLFENSKRVVNLAVRCTFYFTQSTNVPMRVCLCDISRFLFFDHIFILKWFLFSVFFFFFLYFLLYSLSSMLSQFMGTE